MSLIAWYPLDGDLKDKSGNENHLTLVGNEANIASATGGKIGRCHERITYNTADLLRSDKKILLRDEFTIAAWFYSGGTANPNTANGLVTLHNHVENTNPALGVFQSSGSDMVIGCSTGSGTGRTYNAYYGTSELRGAWHHLVYRYDGSVLELLVDGVVEFSVSYSFAYSEEHLELFNWSITNGHSVNYRPDGKLNDVRVYDSFITDREVDELLDVKVVHLSGAPLFGVNLQNGHATGSHYRNSVVNYDDTFIVTTTGDAGNWYTNSLSVDDMDSDTPYAFGVELVETNDPAYDEHLYFISYQNEGVGDGTRSGTRHDITQTGIINKSIIVTDSSDILKLTSRIAGVSDGNSYWYKFARNVCIKSDSLPNNPQDIQSDVIYDRSGYENHALLTANSASWTENSTIGSSGYYLRPTAEYQFCYIKFINEYLVTLPAFTRAMWVRTTDVSAFLLCGGRTGNNVVNSMRIDSGVLAGHVFGDSTTGSDKEVGRGTTQVSDGEWHHVALTYDMGTYKVYVDGALEGTGDNLNTKPGAAYNLLINYDSGTSGNYEYRKLNEAHISDIRVYASALSADKISRLSRVRASVYDDGEFDSSEFVEGWDNQGSKSFELRSSSSVNTGTFIDGVKTGYQASHRGISFCIFDQSMTLRAYGSLDTYSGTTAQYYEFDGEVIVASANDVPDSAQAASNYIKDAIDRMEDGWLMTAARCDASTTQDGTLHEYFVKYFGVTANHNADSRGTWAFAGIKNGELIGEFAEGRRYNSSGERIYYTRSLEFDGDFHKSTVGSEGVARSGELIEIGYKPSIVDYSTWVIGESDAIYFDENGLPSENIIETNINPWGDRDVIWAARDNTTTSNSDGGFNSSHVPVDITKHYRFSIWLKRDVAGNGAWYVGTNGGTKTVTDMSGTDVGNPYFQSSYDLPNGEDWFLVVAYVFADGTTVGTQPYNDAGIYDSDGNYLMGVDNYKMQAGLTSLRIRSYLYYSTDPETVQFFYRPRIDEMGANEPSFADLLSGADNPNIIHEYAGNSFANSNTRFNKGSIMASSLREV